MLKKILLFIWQFPQKWTDKFGSVPERTVFFEKFKED